MLGYVIDVECGAGLDNPVHVLALPLLLLAAALVSSAPRGLPCGLIWLAYIGIAAALGYRWKYPTFFKDTHWQHT